MTTVRAAEYVVTDLTRRVFMLIFRPFRYRPRERAFHYALFMVGRL
jgi:hypothetical protein